MSFKIYLGRLFLVMMFVFPGAYKLIHPGAYQISMLGSFLKFGMLVSEKTGYAFDNSISSFLTQNAEYFVYLVAIVQILASVLVVFGSRFGAFLLMMFLGYLSITTNNPFNYEKREDKILNVMMILINIGVTGALLISCSRQIKVKTD